MNKLITIAFLLLANHALWAQTPCEDFRAYLYNKEYGVFLKIDFCDESITIPDQDFYGSLPGYMGKKVNNFIWLITSAEVKGKKAKLTMINEFGSEDLIASLVRENDSLYVFRQEEGSQLKLSQKGKWQKMPKKMEFIRQKE
jgi:hypothetical protein